MFRYNFMKQKQKKFQKILENWLKITDNWYEK